MQFQKYDNNKMMGTIRVPLIGFQNVRVYRSFFWSISTINDLLIRHNYRHKIVSASSPVLSTYFHTNTEDYNASGNTVSAVKNKREKKDSTLIRSIKSILTTGQVNDQVRVRGWVKSFRNQKKFVFVDVYDGLSFHQLPVVIPAEKKPEFINMHTSVDITGVLVQCPNNPALLELHPTGEIKLLGPCDQVVYPFSGKSKYTQDYIRQFVHLRPKTKKFASTLRLRNAVNKTINDYFHRNEFIHVHTPILTSNDCEGAGEAFIVRPENEKLLKQMVSETQKDNSEAKKLDHIFFNKKVNLTVSSQLHLESLVGGLKKVWTCSPVFRSENAQSTRHLSEFYMLEAEIAFAYNIEDILEIMENIVHTVIREVLTEHIHDWKTTTENNLETLKLLESIIKQPFTVMTYEDAKTLLNSKAGETVIDEKGLSREQELLLTGKFNNGIPVFVIDWPGASKPFYMRQCNYDSSKVSAVDLLVPSVGELCGGSLREFNIDILQNRINQTDPSGKLKDSLQWYIDLRKFGGAPSGGFGLGFDRLMLLLTGIGNIKDVSPFPRWAHHCPL